MQFYFIFLVAFKMPQVWSGCYLNITMILFYFPCYFVLPQITELCTTIPTILSHSLNRAPQVMNSFTQLFIHWPKKSVNFSCSASVYLTASWESVFIHRLLFFCTYPTSDASCVFLEAPQLAATFNDPYKSWLRPSPHFTLHSSVSHPVVHI